MPESHTVSCNIHLFMRSCVFPYSLPSVTFTYRSDLTRWPHGLFPTVMFVRNPVPVTIPQFRFNQTKQHTRRSTFKCSPCIYYVIAVVVIWVSHFV